MLGDGFWGEKGWFQGSNTPFLCGVVPLPELLPPSISILGKQIHAMDAPGVPWQNKAVEEHALFKNKSEGEGKK